MVGWWQIKTWFIVKEILKRSIAAVVVAPTMSIADDLFGKD